MIKLETPDGLSIPFTKFNFPTGESSVKIGAVYSDLKHVTIDFMWESNEDLIDLMLTVDAIRRINKEARIFLIIGYLPYSRQDRVCNAGESLSLAVITSLINSLEFTRVYTWDCHSDVGLALLDNVVHVTSSEIIARSFYDHAFDDTLIVSPDAGANKKVQGIAKDLGFKGIVRADKTRDVATGKITGTVVYSEHLGDQNLLVVDDILDGGGTFIPLYEELRKLTTGSICLYVTHGIFTKGFDSFANTYDKIYVGNLMNKTGAEVPKYVQVL